MPGRPLNAYGKRILEIFRESYPEAAHFRGGRKLGKRDWESIFPEILEDVEAKEDFLHAVDVLSAERVLSVKWKRFKENDRVEALYLEDPRKLYALGGAPFPGDERETMLALVYSWRPKTGIARAVKELAAARLEAYQPLPLSSGSPVRELEDILILFDLVPGDTERLPLRALSVRLYSDSKRIESVMKAADSLARTAEGVTLSQTLGLERSFPEALCALRGALIFTDGPRWDLGGRVLSLPAATVREITTLLFDSPNPSVLCVENKETFYVYAAKLRHGGGPFDACLYTGGHLNPAVADTVRIVTAAGARIFHHGDLDPDGLIIFQETDAAAGGTARPFRMDTALYERYLPYGYPLRDGQVKRLSLATSGKLAGLKDAIMLHKKGIEQEVIDPEIS